MFLFSCTIASVEIFRTILTNGHHSGNNECPDFNRNVFNVSVISEMLVLHFLRQLGDSTGISGQGPGQLQHCNVFNYYKCKFCQISFYHQ